MLIFGNLGIIWELIIVISCMRARLKAMINRNALKSKNVYRKKLNFPSKLLRLSSRDHPAFYSDGMGTVGIPRGKKMIFPSKLLRRSSTVVIFGNLGIIWELIIVRSCMRARLKAVINRNALKSKKVYRKKLNFPSKLLRLSSRDHPAFYSDVFLLHY